MAGTSVCKPGVGIYIEIPGLFETSTAKLSGVETDGQV